MSKIDTSELQRIVTGRVVPHIYSFLTNTLPNYLKVGDTYRPVEERLNEWRTHYQDLEEVSRSKATINDEIFFRDHAVHAFLRQKGILQIPLDPSKKVYSKEFFERATGSDVSDAIKDIVNNFKKTNTYEYYTNTKEVFEFHFNRIEDFSPRQNQQEVIDNFSAAIEKDRKNLLMYAVMRFGKSITSMWCAKKIDSKLTVVVSAKADVWSEWKYTVESHRDFKGYRFIDKDDLKKGVTLSNLYGQSFKTGSGDEEICTNLVLFLTLQDIAGSTEKIKTHHNILKVAKVDLLVVDETHFGARAPVLGKILAGVEVDDEEKKLLKNDEDSDKLGSLIELKPINASIRLHLSGTPYRILMGSEFEQEDIIAFVQFSDIYEAKLRWSADNLEKEEWENPYYGFPQMIRFAFDPNESSRKRLASIPGSKPAELFTPISLKKGGEYNKFKYEQEVIDLLQVLDGSKTDTNLLGLLDNETVKAGKLAQHVVIVLPYRASCDAFENLIKKNKVLFKNIADYKLFNISGYDTAFKGPEAIKSAISKAAQAGKKTITLTVNRMLTGTTVPQWDTMIYLKGTASPQEYDQAIFRLQSAWVEKYKDEKGGIIKYDMKPQTLLVDLDPTRLFYLQELKAFTYGVNTLSAGNENIEKSIERELRISPVIRLNAEENKLVEVTAAAILDEVREYLNSRTITEDVKEIGIDLSLKEDPAIFKFVSELPELGGKNGLTIKPTEGEGDVLEWDERMDDGGEEDGPIGRDTDAAPDSEDISSFEKRFRTYYVMILLFAFLSKTEEKSLRNVIENLDANEDNRRIAGHLGLNKSGLMRLRDRINPFVLKALDYKIQNASFRSSDAAISPVKHIDIAINKFGRLSAAEVFTPLDIVHKMYDAFDEEFWRNVKGVKVLDIASKSGIFAQGFVEKATKYGVKIDDIKDSFYSIPTSSAAYEFTRKMYEALGLNVDNIVRHFNSFSLIKLNNDEVKDLLSQDKKFCDISLSDLKSYTNNADRKETMKFTAVVGNPPYQINVKGNTRTAPIYNHFIDTAQRVSDLVCLIHPARFLFDAGQTPKEWNRRMLNDPHLSVVFFEHNSAIIFPDTDIKGGVSITLWNKNSGKSGLGGKFVPIPELKSILQKVKVGGFERIVFVNTAPSRPLNPRRPKDKKIRSNAFMELPRLFKDRTDKTSTIKIIGVINNVRTEKYISKKLIDDPILNKWKVFLPESNGSGKLGEVLSTPFVAKPNVGCTQTFIQIGSFSSKPEADNCIKYIKTKFCRALLGTLKVTQHNPRNVWKNVPLQDFTNDSDIDWSEPVADIDKQLNKKYGLDKSEIDFIEAHVKAMI